MLRIILFLSLFFSLLNCTGPKTDDSINSEVSISDPASESRENRISNINKLESAVYGDEEMPKKTDALKLMSAYTEFATYFEEDSLCPEYLFKAGGMARYAERYAKAIELYKLVHEKYPDYNKKVEALNWVAFIYDYDVMEKDAAKESYKKLIQLYPDHQFASDARARLETIDLSDEELIKLFQEKNNISQ